MINIRSYIGGVYVDGQWTWTDGSPWDFRDWAVGHPTTRPNDNYLQMMSWYPDGGWSNAPNGFVTLDKYGFICQRKSGEKAEPTIEPEENRGKTQTSELMDMTMILSDCDAYFDETQKCYTLFKETLTWEEAALSCEDKATQVKRLDTSHHRDS